LPRDPAPSAHDRRRGTVDQAVQLLVTRRPQRRPAGDHLTRRLRLVVRRLLRSRTRKTPAERRRRDAAALRHGLLDVLLAGRRPVATRLPGVRRLALEEARPERPALRGGGDALRV